MSKSARVVITAICTAVFLGACAETPGPTEIPDDAIAAPVFSAASQYWIRDFYMGDYYVYVDCLGEVVHYYGPIYFQWHQVEAASGDYNYHFQIRPATPNIEPYYAEGTESGKLYIYKNGGPINESFHAAAGEVYTYIDFETYVAVDSKDKLKAKYSVHTTVNANGDLTVEVGKPWGHECISK